jgi:uncharacterized coiled-coil protein SlyX
MRPNPWIILAVLIALGAFYGYGHHKGWTQRDQEMQVEIAKKNNEARKTEQEMTQKLAETSNALTEANNVVTKKQTALDAAIRAGRVRLPTPSCVSTTQSAPTPAGNTETRSEPDRPTNETSDADRATLAAIAEIVAQGDRNTAQLNACIDAYTKVMESINGQR